VARPSGSIETARVRKDGTRVAVALTITPIRDRDGAVVSASVVARDITARKAAEEALAASERRHRALFEHANDLVAVLDARATLREVSPSHLRALGYAPGELKGRPILDYIHPEDAAAVQRAFAACLAAPGAVTTVELRLRRADGSWRMVEAINHNHTGDPAIGGVLVTSRDVTVRKRMEDELARSNAELAQFAYVASHDLQEPLRTITNYLQLLKRRYQGRVLDAGADEYMAFAVDGAARMQALIQAVLAYARAGTHGGTFAPVACRALVDAAVATLEARIADTGARVAHEGLPTVRGDGAQLGQLFQNLIGNALKFRRQGVTPEVTVTAARAGAEWTIAVRDNGIGIPPDQAARVFQMFQRLHTREEYEGTGIGLALCQKIVERHGGRIWVESTPGEGATVLFTLPANEAEARGAREETTA